MKVIELKEFSLDGLTLTERPQPKPGAGEVLVRTQLSRCADRQGALPREVSTSDSACLGWRGRGRLRSKWSYYRTCFARVGRMDEVIATPTRSGEDKVT
ncbi:MAG: hypothetical protein ACREV4_10130, partial [Gammaproteobacteria bacterium]